MEGKLDLRHIMLSSVRGVVTELERVGTNPGNGKQYVFRCRKALQPTGALLDLDVSDSSVWTGFRYRDAQWSFVKRAQSKLPD